MPLRGGAFSNLGGEFGSAAVGGVSEHDVLGMESRLAQLRADMKHEKEKRSGGAPFWNRGQEGRLHNYRTGKDLPKAPPKPRTPTEPRQRASAGRQASAAYVAHTAAHAQHAPAPAQVGPAYAAATEVCVSAAAEGAGSVVGASEEAFDEAESRRSFLEALNEWRTGGSSGVESTQEGSGGGDSSGGAAAVSTATGEDAAPRPQSSHTAVRPATYFARLAISKEAKVAGAEAAAAVPTAAGLLASDAVVRGKANRPEAVVASLEQAEAEAEAHGEEAPVVVAPDAPRVETPAPVKLDPHTASLEELLGGEEIERATVVEFR